MIYDSFKDIKDDEFYRLTGIKRGIFLKMIEILKIAEQKQKARGGRKNKLSLEDRLLMTLEYWRLYNPYVFLAHKYGINKSNCVRNIFWIENVLVKHENFHIPGKKELMKSNPETQMLVIDATESSVERIKKKQKKCYSGKKKQCTIKSQVIANVETKKIISTNFTFGSTHDYKLFKNSDIFINHNDIILVDSGYQGLQKIHKNTLIPIKKNKSKSLSKEEKVHNHDLCKIRVRIEHIFAWLKRFKIFKHHYRNRLKRFCLRFNLICGIFNLHLK